MQKDSINFLVGWVEDGAATFDPAESCRARHARMPQKKGALMYERWVGHISLVLFYGISLMAVAIALIVLKALEANFGSVADWLAAIGTIGAFAGTIWLATSERRRTDQERNDVALATLHHVVVPIGHISGNVRDLLDNPQDDLSNEFFNSVLEDLSVLDPIDYELTGKIVILGGVATDIARGHAMIEAAKRLIRVSMTGTEGREITFSEAIKYLSEADKHFDRVIKYYDERFG